VVPLIHFTAGSKKDGPICQRAWLNVLAWIVAEMIIAFDLYLIADPLQ
jgi:Mn2+/Fe2+ NRAMP family transporter